MIYRLFDLIFLFILVPLFLPLLFLIYIYLYFTIGKPVFFIQNRSGYRGKSFIMYKFRTMSIIKKQKRNAIKKIIQTDRERVLKSTKFLRKTRLDEIPQLYNVLKNEISFVGPRPLLLEYNNLYNSKQKKRLTVKPGITGWSQIKGGNLISWKKKFELDLWYIENKSIYLYLKIILLTFVYFVNRIFNNKFEEEIYMHKKFNGKN